MSKEEKSNVKQVARRSKSSPDCVDSGDESNFERKSSLRKKLFGLMKTSEGNKSPKGTETGPKGTEMGHKGTETDFSEALSHSNDSISTSKSGKQNRKTGQNSEKNNKGDKSSKRRTFIERFTGSRPLSVVETSDDNSPRQSMHPRSRSDASDVKKCLEAGTGSAQTGIVLENSPTNASYHTVVSSYFRRITLQ